MPPLAVDPAVLSGAGGAVAAVGNQVAAAVASLTAGFGANTGQDAAGEVFGLAYQDAAAALLKAAAAGVNACRFNGAKIQLSASNYSIAEAASTLGGGFGVLPPPSEPEQFAAPGPPGTLGPGEPPPLLWSVVQLFVGDLWPNGDVAGLRAAAGRWRGFAAVLNGVVDQLNGPKMVVAGQQIPEGEAIQTVLSSIGTDMAAVGAQCAQLAGALEDFADEVARAQNAIRDLLDLLSVSGLWDQVMSFFEGDALDEIKEIAADIRAVLHNMGRQARAQEQLLRQGMQILDGLVVGMQRVVRGELTQFLGEDVGNPVATVFDTWVNVNEGFVKAAFETAHGLDQLDPTRFLNDPEGAAATWKGMTRTGLINHFANPQDAVAADKEMLRGLLHLDDWRADRPGLGAGGNLFDIASLFIGGGSGAGARGAAVGGRGAGAAVEGADAAGLAGRGGRIAGEVGDVAGAAGGLRGVSQASRGLTTNLENLSRAELPVGGRPVGLPPVGSPVGSRPPEPALPRLPEPPVGPRPVEPALPRLPEPPASGRPVGLHEPEAVARPAVLDGQPAPAGSRSADSGPAPVSPGGSPVEPAPVAAHSAPVPTPAAPHAPASVPAGRPAELPAPGALGHEMPSGAPSPVHGGGPRGPVDGAAADGHTPAPPHDGLPHGPDDGGPHPDDASSGGLSAEARDEIIATPKGSRPDPSEYLSPAYIESHLEQFTDGATRFMPESNLEKYGIAQRDGTSFVMPKSEADAMIEAAQGNLRAMEDELGLPENFLDSNTIVRIDIADPKEFNLRIPSGNEAGANEQWIPGGRLPNGASEAIVDGGNIPPDDYTVTNVFE
ncbi:hypothetical protein F0Q45_19885 [Mycobacterium simiae]|uniref:Outer membrane channel protein CpnT-like N-terminal domain-containing protein n=1 Tax=Mycobacterium simiae TaxID=1784 RepID=A0A5B1BIT5_MYCSI|nr:hypothetical protein [Mycobacterium simiae]KAA1248567.1 hypothetical protein F0Q45_19885 [Mycobacterium simiae]